MMGKFIHHLYLLLRHDDGPLVKLFLQTHTDSLTGISCVD